MQLTLLGGAVGEHLFQLLHRQRCVALLDGHHFAGLEAGQFALVIDGLARGTVELVFDLDQALFVVAFVGQKAQGLLEYGLQGFLVGVGQFAVGYFVQAELHGLGRRRITRVNRANGKAQAEQDCCEERAQSWHRIRSSKRRKFGV